MDRTYPPPSPFLKAHLKVHKISYSLHSLEKYFVHYCFPLQYIG